MNSRVQDIPSPCVNVCTLDRRLGLCLGCRRSLQEIADWLEMSPEQKLQTLERVAQRKRSLGEL
jgi:predicted Fe-S protein YdhL (DUF1289 family)